MGLIKHIKTGNLFLFNRNTDEYWSSPSRGQVLPKYLVEDSSEFENIDFENVTIININNNKITHIKDNKTSVEYRIDQHVEYNNVILRIVGFEVGFMNSLSVRLGNLSKDNLTFPVHLSGISSPQLVFVDQLGKTAKYGTTIYSTLITESEPKPYRLTRVGLDNKFILPNPDRVYFVEYVDALKHNEDTNIRFSKKDIINFIVDNFKDLSKEMSNVNPTNIHEYCHKKVSVWLSN